MPARLAADIGGTFTDLVLLDPEGRLHVEKTSSTPGDFKQGVLGGVDQVFETANRVVGPDETLDLGDVDYFVHGATVVLNALLERKLPLSALLTTAGFRDVLEIMRTNNPYMYDLGWIKPAPLVPRALRYEVEERVRHTGEELTPLDESAAREIARRLKDQGIGTVAICFLHSYANPAHERRAREILLDEYPGCVVVISSDVAPEIREFERTSTAVINASTVPIITSYLDDLTRELNARGLKRELYVMQSNGGVIPAGTAREYPARTVMSGPSGGVVGAQFLAGRAGLADVVTIDMGGTSSDMGVIVDGLALTVDESRIEGWPIMAPMIEILAIGAGGGSIAWIDDGGALRVGPESAGAEPGPVCYRRGGTLPTVSDACLVLGRLNPGYFLGGAMALDAEGARAALTEKIAAPLGLEPEAAAEGIIKVVTANMAKAMRSILIGRGHDPRDFTLMAFGGAGGMVAGELLRIGEVGGVMVPNNPGALCAVGMLATDFRHDKAQSNVVPFAAADWGEIGRQFDGLRAEGLARLAAEGVGEAQIGISHVLDVRYIGQDHYLRIYVDRDDLDAERIAADFNALHEKTYGYATPEFAVEMVNLRIFSVGTVARPEIPEFPSRPAAEVLDPKASRPVYFDAKLIDTAIYGIEDLYAGDTLDGPLIVEDPRSTLVVMPEQRATVDRFRNIFISRRDGAGGE